MKKAKRFILSSLFLLLSTIMYAQQEITGTVSDDMGPVIGATVMEKGTTNGTVTDFDGNFKIKVAPGKTLVFSYIGYSPVEKAAANGMTVELKEDAAMLNEVVVTGYQVQRKADLTGAVGVMDMKKPMSEGSPSMLNSMQGRMPGVQITTDGAPGGEGSKIRIRGMGTVNGQEPLYIIDGVATESNLSTLNSADIESIQVLKDASSASIYGSRAANGVVIITTKRGKGENVQVGVNYSATMQTIAKTYETLNAEEWGRMYWMASRNSNLPTSNLFYGNGATPQLAQYLDADHLVPSADTDWQDAVYRTAWTHNLAANVSRGGEKGSVMLSANYIDQQGIIDYTKFTRFNIRVNSDYKIGKYVKVGENLMVAQWSDNGAAASDDRGVPFTAMRQNPAIPVRDLNGQFVYPYALNGSDIANPVQMIYNTKDNTNRHWRIFGNGFIEVTPIEGLALKSNIGYEHVDGFSKAFTYQVAATSTNALSRGYGVGDTWTWTNTANYMHDFGRDHHLTALFGTEAISYRTESMSAEDLGFAFNDPHYMLLGLGSGDKKVSEGISEWALFSLFGKVDYNYADRYLLSATLRRDQTSRLDKDHNSGVFPAFSAAWRLSEEKFFQKNNIVSDLKLRLGWGQNGNAAISDFYSGYSTLAYDSGNGSYDLNGAGSVTQGLKINKTGNKNLKWETTTQTNIGLDASLFGGSLAITADYYFKKTTDMLTVPPQPSIAGENATYYMNTGEMKNSGFEFIATYRSPQYGDFSWDGTFNISKYKNKLVKFNDQVHDQGNDIRLMEGQPMGVYYGYVVDGLFQNDAEVAAHATQSGAAPGRMRYRDLNGDGQITSDDRCIIGDPNPDWSMGLNLDFNYKNWTLSTFFTGAKRQLDFAFGGADRYNNHGKDILKAWTPENPGASIPALTFIDNNLETTMSTYYIEDGSYMKCKYIKLAYDFGQPQWMKAIGMGSLNVYAQMENVFTITGYDGLDPEIVSGGWGERVDVSPYPHSRSFTLGLNLSF